MFVITQKKESHFYNYKLSLHMQRRSVFGTWKRADGGEKYNYNKLNTSR